MFLNHESRSIVLVRGPLSHSLYISSSSLAWRIPGTPLKQMELKINSLLGKFRSKNKTQVRTDMDKKWAERILEYDSQG